MGTLSNLVSPLILYDMENKCDNTIMHTLYSAWHIVGASQVIGDGKTIIMVIFMEFEDTCLGLKTISMLGIILYPTAD